MDRQIISSTFCSLLLLLSANTLAQQSDPATGLAITEVSWKSSHPSSNDDTGLGGNANGDWYELTNFGNAAIDLGGYLMDDDDQLFGKDYAVLPSIVLQPNETIIVVQETNPNRPDGFRSAWNLPSDLRLLGECTSLAGLDGTGDSFSGLGSGGDELNIYPPSAIDADGNPVIDAAGELVPPILAVVLPAAVAGQSHSWDSDGSFLDFSVANGSPVNGAYTALHDGSETAGPFAALDIASPGYVHGLDSASASVGDQPTLTRFFNQPHVNCPVEARSCDADGDGDCDLDDLNALYAANGTAGPLLDMDGSGTIDEGDIDDWLSSASDSDNPSKPSPASVFKSGDLNLDGKVDSTDLGNLLNNFGQTNGPGWRGGDVNLDLSVDSTDLGRLLNEFGHDTVAASTAAVPEPSSCLMFLTGVLAFAGFIRRRK